MINVAWAKVLLGHGTQLSYSSGNDFVKRDVFNCLLKEKREVAVVTLVGRLFHVRAAITRKHLSPMVRSRVLGTIRRGWEPARSRCSDSASSVQWKSRLMYGGAMLWRQRKTFCILVTRVLCKNGWTQWTDLDAVWEADSYGSKETCIRWSQDRTNPFVAERGDNKLSRRCVLLWNYSAHLFTITTTSVDVLK